MNVCQYLAPNRSPTPQDPYELSTGALKSKKTEGFHTIPLTKGGGSDVIASKSIDACVIAFQVAVIGCDTTLLILRGGCACEIVQSLKETMHNGQSLAKLGRAISCAQLW